MESSALTDSFLKRWKTPSLLKTLRLDRAFQMVLYSTLIFFKYRSINKSVVNINHGLADHDSEKKLFVILSSAYIDYRVVIC